MESLEKISEEEINILNNQLDKIINRLAELNCNTPSCHFGKTKGGMHTNGGCGCLKHVSFKRREKLEKLFFFLGSKK